MNANTCIVLVTTATLLLPVFTGLCVNAEPKPPVWKLKEPISWDITQPRTIYLRGYIENIGSLSVRDLGYNQTNNLGLSISVQDSEDLKLNINPINLSWTGEVAIHFLLVNDWNGIENATSANITFNVLHAKGDFVWLTVPKAPLVIVGIPFKYHVEAFSYLSPYEMKYSLLGSPEDVKINASNGNISVLTLDPKPRTTSVTVIASDGISEINYTFNISVYLLKMTIDAPSQGARVTGKVQFHGAYFGPPNGYVQLTFCREKNEYPKCWDSTVPATNNQWTREFDVHYSIVQDGKYTLRVQPCDQDNETHSTLCTESTTVSFYADKSNSYFYADPIFVMFMMVLPIICIIGIGLIMLRYLKK